MSYTTFEEENLRYQMCVKNVRLQLEMATLSFKCQSTLSKLSQMCTFSNCLQQHLALVLKILGLTTIELLHDKTCA